MANLQDINYENKYYKTGLKLDAQQVQTGYLNDSSYNPSSDSRNRNLKAYEFE